MKQPLNEEFRRMQKLAGIDEIIVNNPNDKLKFNQVEKDRKYIATTDFGIFKKGEEIFVDTIRNFGTEVVLELSNNEGKSDSIKGDLGEEVEVFK